MNKENNEDRLKEFVQNQEKEDNSSLENKEENFGNLSPRDRLLEQAKENINERNNIPLNQAKENRINEIKNENSEMGLGYLPINLKDLPTGGIFYPSETKIFIRSANGREISHWSMINEEEITEIDDGLNFMLEHCLSIKIPNIPMASYKDLKEIDRFYLILSIRDLTFPSGTNNLQIKISEGKYRDVVKDDVDFINIDQKLMEKYDQNKHCFVFKTKLKDPAFLNIYMPTVGVSQFLKEYIQRKNQRQEGFDKDFLSIAPLLIKDWRGLNDKTYEDFLIKCSNFSVYEYSLLAKIKKLIEGSISPVFKYTDEDGAECTSPLNFCGGIKSIFLLNMEDFD